MRTRPGTRACDPGDDTEAVLQNCLLAESFRLVDDEFMLTNSPILREHEIEVNKLSITTTASATMMYDYDSPYLQGEERPDQAAANAAGRADDARAEQADCVRTQLEDEFNEETQPPVDDDEMKDQDEFEDDDDDPELGNFHSADQGDSPPARPSIEYNSPNPNGFSRTTFEEARRQSQTFRLHTLGRPSGAPGARFIHRNGQPSAP